MHDGQSDSCKLEPAQSLLLLTFSLASSKCSADLGLPPSSSPSPPEEEDEEARATVNWSRAEEAWPIIPGGLSPRDPSGRRKEPLLPPSSGGRTVAWGEAALFLLLLPGAVPPDANMHTGGSLKAARGWHARGMAAAVARRKDRMLLRRVVRLLATPEASRAASATRARAARRRLGINAPLCCGGRSLIRFWGMWCGRQIKIQL